MRIKSNSARRPAKLRSLTAQFDALLARMQTSEVRKGMKNAFGAASAGGPKTDVPPTRAYLADEALRATDLGRAESEPIIEHVFDQIIKRLQKGEKIQIPGFGLFHTSPRRSSSKHGRRKTANKRTVRSERVARFEPSEDLTRFINAGDSTSDSEV